MSSTYSKTAALKAQIEIIIKLINLTLTSIEITQALGIINLANFQTKLIPHIQ